MSWFGNSSTNHIWVNFWEKYKKVCSINTPVFMYITTDLLFHNTEDNFSEFFLQ